MALVKPTIPGLLRQAAHGYIILWPEDAVIQWTHGFIVRGGKPDSEAWHVHIGALEDSLRSKLLERKLNPEQGRGILDPSNPDESVDILLHGNNDEDLSS